MVASLTQADVAPVHTADTIRQSIRDAHRWEWSQEEYWGVAQLLNLYGEQAWFEAERQGLHRLAGRIGDHGRALEILASRGSDKTARAA